MTGPEDLAWAAMMLARTPDVCASILAGRRVRVGGIDPFMLHRAFRGGKLPNAEAYVLVTVEMLEAVSEAGPVQKVGGAR